MPPVTGSKPESLWLLESRYFGVPFSELGGLFRTHEAAAKHALRNHALKSFRAIANGEPFQRIVFRDLVTETFQDLKPRTLERVKYVQTLVSREQYVSALNEYNILVRSDRLYLPTFETTYLTIWE